MDLPLLPNNYLLALYLTMEGTNFPITDVTSFDNGMVFNKPDDLPPVPLTPWDLQFKFCPYYLWLRSFYHSDVINELHRLVIHGLMYVNEDLNITSSYLSLSQNPSADWFDSDIIFLMQLIHYCIFKSDVIRSAPFLSIFGINIAYSRPFTRGIIAHLMQDFSIYRSDSVTILMELMSIFPSVPENGLILTPNVIENFSPSELGVRFLPMSIENIKNYLLGDRKYDYSTVCPAYRDKFEVLAQIRGNGAPFPVGFDKFGFDAFSSTECINDLDSVVENSEFLASSLGDKFCFYGDEGPQMRIHAVLYDGEDLYYGHLSPELANMLETKKWFHKLHGYTGFYRNVHCILPKSYFSLEPNPNDYLVALTEVASKEMLDIYGSNMIQNATLITPKFIPFDLEARQLTSYYTSGLPIATNRYDLIFCLFCKKLTALGQPAKHATVFQCFAGFVTVGYCLNQQYNGIRTNRERNRRDYYSEECHQMFKDVVKRCHINGKSGYFYGKTGRFIPE